jgi:hypothetical protein
MLAEIYDGFSEGLDTTDLNEARALLDELGAKSSKWANSAGRNATSIYWREFQARPVQVPCRIGRTYCRSAETTTPTRGDVVRVLRYRLRNSGSGTINMHLISVCRHFRFASLKLRVGPTLASSMHGLIALFCSS